MLAKYCSCSFTRNIKCTIQQLFIGSQLNIIYNQEQKLWDLHSLSRYSILIASLIAHSWSALPKMALKAWCSVVAGRRENYGHFQQCKLFFWALLIIMQWVSVVFTIQLLLKLQQIASLPLTFWLDLRKKNLLPIKWKMVHKLRQWEYWLKNILMTVFFQKPTLK